MLYRVDRGRKGGRVHAWCKALAPRVQNYGVALYLRTRYAEILLLHLLDQRLMHGDRDGFHVRHEHAWLFLPVNLQRNEQIFWPGVYLTGRCTAKLRS